MVARMGSYWGENIVRMLASGLAAMTGTGDVAFRA